MMSDLFTGLAAVVESAMYTGKMNGSIAVRYTLVGIASRILEKLIRQNMYNVEKMSDQAKNQVIVFALNYLISVDVDGKKANNFFCALRGVNADLLGKWITDAIMEDKGLVNMPA